MKKSCICFLNFPIFKFGLEFFKRFFCFSYQKNPTGFFIQPMHYSVPKFFIPFQGVVVMITNKRLDNGLRSSCNRLICNPAGWLLQNKKRFVLKNNFRFHFKKLYFSLFLESLVQSVASGKAISLSVSIICPHSSQIPYLPIRTRVKAFLI